MPPTYESLAGSQLEYKKGQAVERRQVLGSQDVLMSFLALTVALGRP